MSFNKEFSVEQIISAFVASIEYVNEEYLEEILDKVAYTSFDRYTSLFKFIYSTLQDGDKVTPDLITSMFGIKPFGEPTKKIITFLIKQIDKEYNDYKIQQAVLERRYEEVEGLLKEQSTPEELESFTIDDYAKYYYTQKDSYNLIKIGIPELDETVGGFYSTSTVVVGGGPGTGKSTFAINVMYSVLNQGKNVLFITLETAPEVIYSALLSRHSYSIGNPIEYSKIIKFQLNDFEMQKFNQTIESFKGVEGKYKILSASSFRNFQASTLDGVIEKVREQLSRIDMIIVDYVQCLRYFCKDVNYCKMKG